MYPQRNISEEIVHNLNCLSDYTETLQRLNGEVEDVLIETCETYTVYYKPNSPTKKYPSDIFLVTVVPCSDNYAPNVSVSI